MAYRVALVDGRGPPDELATALEEEPGVAGVGTLTDPAAVPERVADEGYDCVASAHAPPAIDGLALLDDVRERSPVPFVLLVDRDADVDVDTAAALDRGVDDVVRIGDDPTDHALVANRIGNAVAARRSAVTPVGGGGELAEAVVTRLLEMTRDCMAADDAEAVHRIAVDVMENVFDLPSCSFRVYDPDREVLTIAVGGSPQAGLTAIADRPDYAVPASMPGKAFVESVPILSRVRRDGPDPFGRGENMYSLYIPAGDHGVFSMAVTESRWPEFGPAEIRVMRTFAANAAAALDRIETEAELTARQAELEASRQDLARQNRRLERFASFVSHDLRTPLTVLDGHLELARQTGEADHFDRCDRAVERMDQLIDDLLVYAREGGRVEESERVDLDPVVREAWSGAGASTATLSVADDLGAVSGDPGRVQRLLENLFRNAVEHAGETVTVRVGRLDDGDGFYVADDGPGIPPERRDDVFESGVTSDSDGTGFGLAIVAEIATAHGWTVDVTESADGGARFELRTDGDGNGEPA